MQLKKIEHLQKDTQKWVKQICKDYELESHHEKLLILAAESWEKAQSARETLLECGDYFENRHGEIRPHPGIKTQNDSMIRFARLMRELGLDMQPEEVKK